MKRFAFLMLAGALCAASPLFAAAPVFSNSFVSVTLDGVRLGTDTDPSNYSMFPSVVYDPQSGLFHMWVANSSALSIEGLRHATSSDGVHFISDGNLSFAGGSPFPIYGAPTEPQFEFPRAAKIGDDWKLLIWTENAAVPGQYGDYNYNESVNEIGVDPSTLAVNHQGPVYPTNGLGTFGQTTGPYGIVNGKLYVADDRIGGLSKWEYVDATPPSVTPPADTYQDLITGTGYVYFLTHPGDPLGVYVHNVARVLDQGDGTLGVYYALRHPDGSRVNKQIYYAQSGDGGQTWSSPAGLFSNGDAVRVDGAPNQFDFSHPEVTLVGSRRVLYFSTKALDGAFVVATSAAQAPQATSWSDLIGSGVAGGDSGVAAVRTDDGGYLVLGDGYGLSGGTSNFWLLKLDGAGEVEWQRLYLGSGGLNTFFPMALLRAADGGLIMAGESSGGLTRTGWFVKTDALGNVLWSKSYVTCDSGNCGLDPRGFSATSDGGLAFAGEVAQSPTFGVGKIDANGNVVWVHNYPSGAAQSFSDGLVETSDGGLAVAGSIGPNLQPDYRILRTDASGAVVWDESIGGTDIATDIIPRPTGGFVVTGDMATLALDESGNPDWQFQFYGEGTGYRLVATPSGGFAMVGGGNQGAFGHATLAEFDASGTPMWARSFASQTSSYAGFGSAVPSYDGGFLAIGGDTVYPDPPSSDGVSRLLAVKVDAGGNFVGCLDVDKSDTVGATPTSLSPVALPETVVDETANTTVSDLPVTIQDANPAFFLHCSGTLPETLEPAALGVDPLGNGVAEPGEPVVVQPYWTNSGLIATLLAGHVSELADSNGLDTSAPDPDAEYGIVPSLGTVDCLRATGDCYQFQFLGTARPSLHWDTYADETLTTSDPHHQFAKRWVIHIGQSFADVSTSSGFYAFIENILHHGITGGCGAGDYCPTNSVTRAQMAVFLLKSKHGAAFVPPACTGVFGDVACPSLFADWIEELYAEGITGGCSASPLLYCPDNAVTRQQMAVFLLKALNGSGYSPQVCIGIFADVSCPGPFTDWVEDLFNRQITAGCGTNPLLYCPGNPNTREQMAVFLTKTFSLLLYGP